MLEKDASHCEPTEIRSGQSPSLVGRSGGRASEVRDEGMK